MKLYIKYIYEGISKGRMNLKKLKLFIWIKNDINDRIVIWIFKYICNNNEIYENKICKYKNYKINYKNIKKIKIRTNKNNNEYLRNIMNEYKKYF